MTLEFFMPMIPPTATAQQHKVNCKSGRAAFYAPSELADARSKLESHLSRWKPSQPILGGLRLIVRWCFPRGRHRDGEYRLTRPDTDNLNKLLKDCMTRVGFWKDDAQVASELIEKFWAEIPGIYIRVESL